MANTASKDLNQQKSYGDEVVVSFQLPYIQGPRKLSDGDFNHTFGKENVKFKYKLTYTTHENLTFDNSCNIQGVWQSNRI